MKIKTLKTIEELEKTSPTEEQIKNYKIFHNKLDLKSFQNGGEKEKTEFQKFIEKLYEIWNKN